MSGIPDERVDYSTFAVCISRQGDYVSLEDGARYVEGLEREFVHGEEQPQNLHSQLRAKSVHTIDPVTPSSSIPKNVLRNSKALAMSVDLEQDDKFDHEWMPDALEEMLGAHARDPEKMAQAIIDVCKNLQDLVAGEPTLNEGSLPAKVYGDIHGQLRDLLLFLHHFGWPSAIGPCYVFNGDWVDRGAHQIEVLLLVYVLKLRHPNQVFLNRGNHEDAMMNTHMGQVGLLHAVQRRFQPPLAARVFEAMTRSFEYLPLGTVLGSRILVVHGGIGDGKWLLSQVNRVARPLDSNQIAENPMLYNLLWSDPVDEDQPHSFGVHASARDDHSGRLLTFGKDVTDLFLKRNRLQMLIRSHDMLPEGCGYEIMHGGKLVRVFTARDYEGQGNDGSILTVDVLPDKERVMVRAQSVHKLAKR